MPTLTQASHQWATRPEDERYDSLEALNAACIRHRESAAEKQVPLTSLRVEAQDGDIALIGRGGVPASFTHWSFGQLSRLVGAPADYLRTLPATLTVQNLNSGLKRLGDADPDRSVQMLAHQNGGLMVHALTSDRYSRIWNADITWRLCDLAADRSWRVPPARPSPFSSASRPATEADVLHAPTGWGIKVGDPIAPAGLYASDHDMFAFLVDDNHTISDGTDRGLARGFFITNSEVGAASFRITRFLYRFVCGNHMIWGAKQVQQFSLRHVGQAPNRAFSELRWQLDAYTNESASGDENRVRMAQGKLLGVSKDEVLDLIFGKGFLSRKQAEAAYELAEHHRDVDGDPNSAWGIAQGITRLSQLQPYADTRVAMDRAASGVLDLAF